MKALSCLLGAVLLLAPACDSPGGHITSLNDPGGLQDSVGVRRAYTSRMGKELNLDGVHLIFGADGPGDTELTVLWESAYFRADQEMFKTFIPPTKYGFLKVTLIDKRPGEDHLVNAWHWTK